MPLVEFTHALVRPGRVTLEKIRYLEIGDVVLALHVFRPAEWSAEDRRGGVVLFFGGGWIDGSPEQFYPHAGYLAERGLVVFVAEYRVANRHGTDPFASLADAMAALRWVRERVEVFGLNPDRIAAGGGSAGGHLAAGTALLADPESGPEDRAPSRPNALVLFNPVIDNGPGGYGYDRVGERYRAFSPLHNIGPELPPPTVVFHGTEDQLVPLATMERFTQLMRGAGGRCDVHLYEGAGHAFFNWSEAGANLRFYETLRTMDRFLGTLGWLEGGPSLAIPPDARIIESAAPT